MTPEQLSLFTIKCNKQDVRQADLTVVALQSVLSMAFKGEGLMPSDLMDVQLGITEIEFGEKDLTPTARRKQRYGKWEWPDQKLIHWLANRHQERGHLPLDKFFTQQELDKYGICLLKGNKNESD